MNLGLGEPAAIVARFGELAAAAGFLGFNVTAIFCAAVALVLVVGLAAYRLGVRHRAARARRLRERLVGRLHPGAS